MEWLRRALRYGCVGLPLVLLYAGGSFLGRRSARRDLEHAAHSGPAPVYHEPRMSSVAGVQILQFYATPAAILEGDKALLCYGVVNAQAVRLHPRVEPLKPSMNRCLEVRPDRNIEYTLTATGDDGQQVSATIFMAVRPDPVRQPRIVEFALRGATETHGRTVYQLCFQTRNAERITVDPPVLPPTSSAFGCFYVTPQQPTTYTLTATGIAGKKVERRLTTGSPPPAL